MTLNGESGWPEGSPADPSVNEPNGGCPSEHNAVHERSMSCESLPSPPHSPVLRQMGGEGSPDRDPPDTNPWPAAGYVRP